MSRCWSWWIPDLENGDAYLDHNVAVASTLAQRVEECSQAPWRRKQKVSECRDATRMQQLNKHHQFSPSSLSTIYHMLNTPYSGHMETFIRFLLYISCLPHAITQLIPVLKQSHYPVEADYQNMQFMFHVPVSLPQSVFLAIPVSFARLTIVHYPPICSLSATRSLQAQFVVGACLR